MAKRFADSQITRETFKENDSGSDDEKSGHKTASAAVMSKRKIAMPKRKMASFQTRQSEPSNTTEVSSSAFNFLKSSKISEGESDKYAKKKALNLQFRDKITSFIDEDPCCDLSPVLEKYKTFIHSLEATTGIHAQQTFTESKKPINPVNTQQEVPEAEKSSDEEEMKEVKVEGPTFTITTKPPTSDSVFSFGAKKETEKDDEDSDSDAVEIKGPQFTFSGTVKSDVFKLSTPTNKEKQADAPTAGSTESKATPAFSFGKAGSSSETFKEKPQFSFDSVKKAKDNVTAPAPQQQKDDSTPKPKFDFSFSTNKSKTNGTAETKSPSFSFGFGAAAPGSGDAQSDKTAAPSFSFGKPGQDSNGNTDAKPAFSFGKQTQNSEAAANSKPRFSFDNSVQDSAGKTEGKPVFSFGKTAQDLGNKAETKPAFSFGAPNSSTAPSFTFGNTEATSEQTKLPENVNGSKSGFKFALPFEKKSAEVESDKKSESEKQVVEGTAENESQEESKPIDLQNGEEGETPLFSQKSKLMIFNPETKSYDSRGVGEMKLLQSKEDKSKVRFLCRSDGMGNILLNTRVIKDFTYSPLTAENENLIKVPTIETDNKLVTYVVKFKQKADGRQFIKTIADAKKDL